MTVNAALLSNIIQLTDQAIKAVIAAGQKISEVYTSSDFYIQLKEDNTPLTIADRLAHNEIIEQLKGSGLPVLSEEGVHLSFVERKEWDLFWLVDPLDGTKEFIKRNGEFTVNIALIQHNAPVAGVIFVPVTGELYAGIPGIGAYRISYTENSCTFQMLQHFGIKLPEETTKDEYVVVISRSHMNQETQEYIKTLQNDHGKVLTVTKGSSLKICMIAEGKADIYPKIGRTMEWDTAAGHAIVKAAGKNIFLPDLTTELIYNKEDLHNPDFVVK